MFQPKVNCRASDKQGELCQEQYYEWGELRSCCVSTYESEFWKGCRGWRGSILAGRETLAFMVPAAYQNLAVIQIGVNKIPPNFDTLRRL